MSDDKKPTARPPEIAVRSMRFTKPIDIPGKSVTESCDSEQRGGGKRWDISFIPAMRHHLITCHEGERVTTAYVHESMVMSWVPA